MYELLNPRLADWLGSACTVRIRKFQGKPDLLKSLPSRLEGYALARRRGEQIGVVVLLDRDNDDCEELKERLERMASAAGLATVGTGGDAAVVNRVVVRELENWYFGDWTAVQTAFPKVGTLPARFRANADHDGSKTSKAFNAELTRSGIRLDSKPEWARRVGPHMHPDRNSSTSFQVFLAGVRRLAAVLRSR